MMNDEITRKLKHTFNGKKHPLTAADMFRDIENWLKGNLAQETADIFGILDYALPDDRSPLLQDEYYPNIIALVNTGGSEGIYIDFYYMLGEDKNRQRFRIGTFKTLDEGIKAYGLMGQLAGYLTFAGEHYIALNHKNITTID